MRKRTLVSFLAVIVTTLSIMYNNVYHPFDAQSEVMKGVTNIPAEIVNVKEEGLAPGKYIHGQVSKVVDGDTLRISYKGESYGVRLLDIDTPESVKSGTPVQVYGKEASEFVKKTVLDREVKLVFEKGLRDRYGRLLAHVLLEDGQYLNAILVKNGYARVEFAKPNTTHKEYFYNLLKEAVDTKTGLWGLPKDSQPFVKGKKGEYVPSYWTKEKAS